MSYITETRSEGESLRAERERLVLWLSSSLRRLGRFGTKINSGRERGMNR